LRFRWNEWNVEHLERHGVTPEEAERIVRMAKAPYPRPRADGRWLVWGWGDGGRFLQVLFVADEDDEVYVIHARPLTEREKRSYRRKRRS
jgi:uncharacterized protein